MTSVRTQLPYEYYSLKFCVPKEGKKFKIENLGMNPLIVYFYLISIMLP